MRASLQVPENLLQLYVENSPLALIQFNAELRIVAWSERATAMFGWTEDEVHGKTLDEFAFVHEDDHEHVAELFRSMADGPVNWNANTNRNRRRDSPRHRGPSDVRRARPVPGRARDCSVGELIYSAKKPCAPRAPSARYLRLGRSKYG